MIQSLHTPGPLGDNDNGVILGDLDGYNGVAPTVVVVEGYDEDGNAGEQPKANTRPLCAAYNAFDSAAKKLSVNAVGADGGGRNRGVVRSRR
jgi:hypothetical protein